MMGSENHKIRQKIFQTHWKQKIIKLLGAQTEKWTNFIPILLVTRRVIQYVYVANILWGPDLQYFDWYVYGKRKGGRLCSRGHLGSATPDTMYIDLHYPLSSLQLIIIISLFLSCFSNIIRVQHQIRARFHIMK